MTIENAVLINRGRKLEVNLIKGMIACPSCKGMRHVGVRDGVPTACMRCVGTGCVMSDISRTKGPASELVMDDLSWYYDHEEEREW